METASLQSSAQLAYQKQTESLKRSATERHRPNRGRRGSRSEKAVVEVNVIGVGARALGGVPLLKRRLKNLNTISFNKNDTIFINYNQYHIQRFFIV